MKSQRIIAVLAIVFFLAALIFAVAFLFGFETGIWALMTFALSIIFLILTVMRNRPASSSSDGFVEAVPPSPPSP